MKEAKTPETAMTPVECDGEAEPINGPGTTQPKIPKSDAPEEGQETVAGQDQKVMNKRNELTLS